MSAGQRGVEVAADHAGLGKLAASLALAALPIIALAGAYVVFDPFEVLHANGRHFRDPAIIYNRDFNSTEKYLRNARDIPYDSFIFGSSRSWAFLASDWQRHIGSRPVFHFDASGETLFGIHRKVMFLNAQGVRIRNALVVLDHEGLSVFRNMAGHLFIKHPVLSGESWLTFHGEFVSAFVTPDFLRQYLGYKLLGRAPSDERFFSTVEFRVDPVTNDTLWLGLERELLQDPEDYYRRHAGSFPPRDAGRLMMYQQAIRWPHLEMLRDMARVFQVHGTDVRVVISPLYDQIRLNQVDAAILRETFGAAKVFDYSGVNELTSHVTNYYEKSHYRVAVASRILADVYAMRGTVGSPR